MSYKDRVDISTFEGKTIVNISGNAGDAELLFTMSDGTKYKMFHDQDCCESVYLEDVNGDFEDIVNSPILLAEERTNTQDLFGKTDLDSFTWTFYTLATIKGYVVLRWLGESNGYYSESVEIEKI